MLFHVLGPVELSDRDGRRIEIRAEKPRRVLAALLLRANSWVDPAYLVEAVWPVNPPKSSGGNVKTYISHLRSLLPPADGSTRIDSRPGAYCLLVERHECDATMFEDQVASATALLAARQPACAVEQLAAALRLWRGRPYESLGGTAAEVEAERLGALLWHGRYTMAEALLAGGRVGDAIALLSPLTAVDPLREKTWEYLLRALSSDGRWSEALVAYEKARQVLADELGIAPGPELRRLYLEALRADELDPGQPRPAAAVMARDERSAPAGQRGFRKRHWAAAVALLLAVSFALTRVPDSSIGEPVVPALAFVSPDPGQVVAGVITLRVKATNASRLRQVDFHQLTARCPSGGYKRYIGPDENPVDDIYEISFDTGLALDGCLDFGAVGVDRDNPDVLYPHDGTYLTVTVKND